MTKSEVGKGKKQLPSGVASNKKQESKKTTTTSNQDSEVFDYVELFDLSPVCYFILDRSGAIHQMNKKAYQKLNLDPAKSKGEFFSTLINGKKLQDEFGEYLSLLIKTQQQQLLNSEIKKYDSSIVYVTFSGSVVLDIHNNFKYFLIIVNDNSVLIGQKKQIELSLEKAREQKEFKSQFINLALHEFRTPLTTVLSCVWLIEQNLANGQKIVANNYLQKITASVKQINLIIKDFMSEEILDSGTVNMKIESLDLPAFCKELIADIRLSFLISNPIRYEHSGDTFIKSDKKILYHILSNLLTNAVKYSADNLEINVVSTVKNGLVTISVEDKGIGIPESEFQFIFDRFYRCSNSLKFQGTGVGLNISKEWLKLMNGTIHFKSKEGDGSTFTIEFPTN